MHIINILKSILKSYLLIQNVFMIYIIDNM